MLSSHGLGVAFASHAYNQPNQDRFMQSTLKWHMWAFMISGGLTAMLVSHIAAARISYPLMVSHHTTSMLSNLKNFGAWGILVNALKPPAPEVFRPLLGLSGAMCSMCTFVAFENDDLREVEFGNLTVDTNTCQSWFHVPRLVWLFHEMAVHQSLG